MPNFTDISSLFPASTVRNTSGRYVESLRPLMTPKNKVILVDDGSLDGSAELFQQLMPTRTAQSREQRSSSHANRAIEVAHGEL